MLFIKFDNIQIFEVFECFIVIYVKGFGLFWYCMCLLGPTAGSVHGSHKSTNTGMRRESMSISKGSRRGFGTPDPGGVGTGRTNIRVPGSSVGMQGKGQIGDQSGAPATNANDKNKKMLIGFAAVIFLIIIILVASS